MALEPTWTSSVTSWTCPAQFKIYYDDNGVYTEPLTADQLDVLTFNDVNGFLNVETADLRFDQISYTIYLTKESIYSTEPQNGLVGPLGVYEIVINILDPCWISPLTAAVIDDTE